MTRRVLVTGAAGFVGRHLIDRLARDLPRHDEIVATSLSGGSRGSSRLRWAGLDVRDATAVDELVHAEAPTHILHLAAAASVAASSSRPGETWRTNVVGTMNLAEAVARRVPASCVVFVSSAEVYGRAFGSGAALPETTRPEPANAYARSKHSCELLLSDILAGSQLVVLRPFNHIGPGQDETFVAASFAAQIARAEAGLAPPVIETGDLSAEREFLDVRDVVSAYAAILLASENLPARAVFNICGGRSLRISDLLAGLLRLARIPLDVRTASGRLRPNDVPRACGDPAALKAAIGWTPRWPWEDTLRSVLDDARARHAPA